MLSPYSDRIVSGGALIFEIDVKELTQEDLASFRNPPKRNVVKYKLFDDDRDIPLCTWQEYTANSITAHPDLADQSFSLVPSGYGGYIVMYRASLPQNSCKDPESVYAVIDEIRPRLLFTIGSELGLSMHQLLRKVDDIQYHFCCR